MRTALALLLVLLAGPATHTQSQQQAQTLDPIVIGHRGVHLEGVPENTLAAFRTAVAGGAVMLETDVQFTKDDGMVLLHDATLTRTTTCTGTVAAKTLTQVRQCLTDDGQPVTTFAEMLDYAHDAGVSVDAEVKLPGLTAKQARAYVETIAAHGMTEHVTATSFYTSNLNRLNGSGITRGIIDFDRPHTARQGAQRGTVIALNLEHTTAQRVADAHAAGLTVYVWTLHTTDQYSQAKALGVDGVITDDPAGLTVWLTTH